MELDKRIREIEAQRQAASEEARRQGEERKKERQDRYEKELPEALRTREVLFNQLKEAGIINMLETVANITTPYVPETKKKKIKTEWIQPKMRVTELKKLQKEMQENAERIIKNPPIINSRREWRAEAEMPQQLEDGSVDKSLRVKITKEWTLYCGAPGHGIPQKESVTLTYSPLCVLTIEGNELTFQGVFNRKSPNKEAVGEALAQAFAVPKVETQESFLGAFPDFWHSIGGHEKLFNSSSQEQGATGGAVNSGKI